MLTNEDQNLIDQLKESARKIHEAYKAGRMSDYEYASACKLVDEAAYKMEAISSKD